MNQLITRASIADIARRRNAALTSFQRARHLEEEAKQQLAEAGRMLRAAAPMMSDFYLGKDDTARMDDRQYVDAKVWDSLVRSTELNHLMDKKAKDELRQQLLTDPPEFTEETAYSTIEKFAAEAGMIFRRGIALMFSALDRRFRSHSGWKIGSRVILSNAFSDYGGWNYHRDHRSTLQDIERTFLILDGRKPVADYDGIVGEIDRARMAQGFGSARQTEVQSEFYTARIFKNGNLHLWFKRDDLVTLANRMIGEYYGEVVPDGRVPEDEGGLNEPKRDLAKNFGFFPTPDQLAEQIIDQACLYSPDKKLSVLEPSAGTGQLSGRAVAKGAIVDCVEVQDSLSHALRSTGRYRRIFNCDFLLLNPTGDLYDRIIMNPPFDGERDIDHVMHALKFLKDDGLLIAIMSAHTEFAESRKAAAFRDYIARLNGKFSDNPAGSFSSVGTNVNTLTLRVWKNGRTIW
jgi:predicted RNA methylase